MLVLSRKAEESIYIGSNIRVFVVEVRGDRVRLGIDAPREIPILRNEHVELQEPQSTKTESPARVS